MEPDLEKDLKTRGCPVCNHLEEYVFQFFSKWQFDFANDETVKHNFADNKGFCPFHLWQSADFSSNRGMAKGLPAFLSGRVDDLMRLAEAPDFQTLDAVALTVGTSYCPVCNFVKQREREYIHLLADFLKKENGRQVYKASQGVCLRHLKPLIMAVESQETGRFLLLEKVQRLRELMKDLQDYTHKHEMHQRHELTKDEKDSVLRTLIHIAGTKRFVVE